MAEKSHTKPWQRVAVFIIAILFLFTTGALTFALIFQSASSGDSSKSADSKKQLAGTKLKGFKPVTTVSKLQTIDKSEGKGEAVKLGDTITVQYTGAVAATGIIFQSSLDTGQPATLSLEKGKIIPGWANGIPGMKVGGTRRLIIPAAEAYGANPPPNSGIPPNAPLVFDVTLLKIGK